MERISSEKNESFMVRIVHHREKPDILYRILQRLAIAKALDCKIFVEQRKYRILNLLGNEDLSRRLTTNPNETNVHVVGMGSMTPPVSSTDD